MVEFAEQRPFYEVPEAEYHRLLGYPCDHRPAERARELAAWARAWYAEHGRPWIYSREAALELVDDSLRLDGVEFRSPRLQEHFRQHAVGRALLVAVSAGRECEAHAQTLWNEGKPDEYFFLEIFGSAVVEELVARASGRICAEAGVDGWRAVPHYSPGYAGWDVSEQTVLFGLMERGRAQPFPGPIEVLSSGMLRPKKSLLAVFGLTLQPQLADHRGPCESCTFNPCAYRREPYRPAPAAVRSRPAASPGPLATDARYSVNVRALRKWAAERVQLDYAADGTVAARFRFEGTTCSNLGHPLAFDYRVVLSGPDDGYVVREVSCTPAAGDEGHRQMCAYLTGADGLMDAIAGEKPLIGRPLDDVLRWERAPASSGCHCTAESRTHKWGLALEAIHFAMAQSRVLQTVS